MKQKLKEELRNKFKNNLPVVIASNASSQLKIDTIMNLFDKFINDSEAHIERLEVKENKHQKEKCEHVYRSFGLEEKNRETFCIKCYKSYSHFD